MKEFKLTKGSRIKVSLIENGAAPLEVEGIFRGYVKLGDSYALHLELPADDEKKGKKGKKGTDRLIMESAIHFIDIVKKAPDRNKGKKDNDAASTLYT